MFEEYDENLDPLFEWCTALSGVGSLGLSECAQDLRMGPVSCSILGGPHVHRLHWDCGRIKDCVWLGEGRFCVVWTGLLGVWDTVV